MTAKRFQWVYIKDNLLELRDNGVVKVFNNERLEELLNELHEENQALKSDRARYEEECRLDIFKELYEENELLKDDVYNEIDNALTVLKELYEDTPLNLRKKMNQLYNRLESLREEMK